MKPNAKIAIGIFTAILLLAFIPAYDLLLKDKIDSVQVVVVKAGEEIKQHEKITKDKLTIERRRKQDLLDEVVLAKDLNTIIGYDAADLLVGNTMVSNKMIDYDQLLPDESEGEAIRPIINSWIYAQPGSLRRKDTIDIYTISKTNLEAEEMKQDDTVVISSSDKEKEKLNLKKPLLTNVKVVYVKDSSNKEVTNVKETKAEKDERLNATGNISNLEVILNEKDFQLLMEHVVDKRETLYITYN